MTGSPPPRSPWCKLLRGCLARGHHPLIFSCKRANPQTRGASWEASSQPESRFLNHLSRLKPNAFRSPLQESHLAPQNLLQRITRTVRDHSLSPDAPIPFIPENTGLIGFIPGDVFCASPATIVSTWRGGIPFRQRLNLSIFRGKLFSFLLAAAIVVCRHCLQLIVADRIAFNERGLFHFLLLFFLRRFHHHILWVSLLECHARQHRCGGLGAVEQQPRLFGRYRSLQQRFLQYGNVQHHAVCVLHHQQIQLLWLNLLHAPV